MSADRYRRLLNIVIFIVLLQVVFLCYFLTVENTVLQRLARKGIDLGGDGNHALKPNHTCLYLPSYSKYLNLSSEPWKFGELGKILFAPSENGSQVKPTFVELHYARQLVVYTAHTINELTKANPAGCTRWWANPLTASNISSTFVNSRTRKWKLEFDLEPGRIRVAAVLLFHNRTSTNGSSINLREQKKFTLYSVKVLNSDGTSSFIYFRNADDAAGDKRPGITSDSLINMCLCNDVLEEANRRTMEARTAWNQLDPELSMWPPNASFIVTDYIDYLDPNFFLISPGNGVEDKSYCSPETRIIVGIHSAPSHFGLRSAIRETYGSKDILKASNARLVFFLGTVDDAALQDMLDLESERFKDIVQANFVDTYHNLTLKRLTVYQWIYLKCGTGNRTQGMPEYLLKSDDDLMLNVEAALRLGDANPKSETLAFSDSDNIMTDRGIVYCDRPIRDPTNTKWYVPRHIWLPEKYNGRLSGLTSLMRTDLIPNLLQESLTSPLMHIDDVYIPDLIHVLPENSPLLFSLGTLPADPCILYKMISLIISGADEMRIQWKKFSEKVPDKFYNCTITNDTTPMIC